ncbi:PepSY domain-containing protein [Ottowia testudinis]|uniref:PepSY domain-containing protein n=1 Tax=Ottowia testudinis TaxID=2816950 RepID=A0A975CMN3_9BURK|nr:PepSY domain-containing protein [Ottowia testudinis]QTD46994.1 PepSY domain-containing protein [Ottowia testudinis]
MKPIRSAGPLVLSMSLLAVPALAEDDCDAPTQQWQPREAVMQMAARQGWQVQRLKIDDGCYELRGRDAQGRAFKAKVDPRTLNVIKLKQRDHDGEDRASRERRRDRDASQPPRDAAPAEPAAPLPAGGSRATIE